jgi:hypothetical protein
MSANDTGSATQEGVSIARSVGEAVGHKVEDIATRSKGAGADAAATMAKTAQAIADSVSGDSPAVAEYVRGAGQKIDRLANDLRDKKVGDLLAMATEFGRSQPVMMMAGAALVGFALSRLIKAGAAAPAGAEPQAGGDVDVWTGN